MLNKDKDLFYNDVLYSNASLKSTIHNQKNCAYVRVDRYNTYKGSKQQRVASPKSFQRDNIESCRKSNTQQMRNIFRNININT